MKRKKGEKPELTIKQKKFVDAYIKCGNKAEAAREAGYASKYADRQANQTLQLDYVQDYLNEEMKKLQAKNIASAEEVLGFFTKVLRGETHEQTVAPNSTIIDLKANINERINAGKEILKRYPNDPMAKAQLAKLQAEVKLTNAKADALTTQDANVDDAVSDLLNKVRDKESDDK